MCGRYALWLRARDVRERLAEEHMPSQDSAPDDDDTRQTYNFAPGYYGLVYRADVPDTGAGTKPKESKEATKDEADGQDDDSAKETESQSAEYKLQAMKWGLVPFWTKRNPDYGSMMRTINCRDDSLATPGGMWQSMKSKKRCIVIAQGFYEWLKKNDGKEKIPHYVKRKDGKLMCFAGLWDCVKYEDAEEKLYTYTIITTDSNKQLNFLHDRMPVILENGSDDVFKWLDSGRSEWSNDLQDLLQPFGGELECYPVVKDVGKVGNNSPTFVVPINSSQNKQNIANFFKKQQQNSPSKPKKEEMKREEEDVKKQGTEVKQDLAEDRKTDMDGDEQNAETNAPEPESPEKSIAGKKRGHIDDQTGSKKQLRQQKLA